MNDMHTLKTIIYMGTMHGLFTFYFPYQIASHDKQIFDTGISRFLAFPLWIVGAWIIIQCSVDIVRRGRGTPAHLDPPKQLVITGLYRRVRNPIYLGALTVLLGYTLWFGSILVMLYSLLAFLGFHFLIIFIEESILRHNFGAAYEEYVKRVPRWMPKF
jgi:protein-S-isoprenylcysteine O-methyltransferase Ste14